MSSPGALFWSPFLAWCSVLDFNTSSGLGAIQTSGGGAKKVFSECYCCFRFSGLFLAIEGYYITKESLEEKTALKTLGKTPILPLFFNLILTSLFLKFEIPFKKRTTEGLDYLSFVLIGKSGNRFHCLWW